MAIDAIWYAKNAKNRSIVSMSITLLFCFLHMLLWLCIYYRLDNVDLKPITIEHDLVVQTSHAILKLTVLCVGFDVICIAMTSLALFGLQKEFEGRSFVYAWLFGMILYIFLESLISWCFIYWCYERNMILFVVITSVIFWIGRTVILIGCMVQVSSYFKGITETNIPTIVIQEAAPFAGQRAQGLHKNRSASVATVSTIVSNMSEPDAICEKQYPGYLPCSVDFDTMYPGYLYDDYSNYGFEYQDYPSNLLSPTYEEATRRNSNNPPPYTAGDLLTPPVYTEADLNLIASAQPIDSTANAGLIPPRRRP